MELMTHKMRDQLERLQDAANSGQLGALLANFLNASVEATYLLNNRGWFRTRAALQQHIDTLTDLIDTKVHSRQES